MIGSDLIGAWYNSRMGMSLAGTGGMAGAPNPQQVQDAERLPGQDSKGEDVVPPWDPSGEVRALDDLRRGVLGGDEFFDLGENGFTDMDAGEDEKSLFSLYTGLRKLQSLATAASERNVNSFDQMRFDQVFQRGLDEMGGYFSELDLEGVSLFQNEDLDRAESALGIARGMSEYTTGVVHRGAFDAEVEAFQGADAQFSINVRKNGQDIAIDVDLNELGGEPRTLDNVVGLINSKLEDAGVISRFSREKLGEPNEFGIVEGNDWGLKISGIITEQLSFSADGGPAVYVAGTSGTLEGSAGQLSKITGLDGELETAFSKRVEADATTEEVAIFGSEDETRLKETDNPLTIQDTARAADGSVYVVGQTSAGVDGQSIKGESDLVLMKYDSTGKQVWTRTLGAAEEANGASLATDADGNVVVAGSVKGVMGDSFERGGQDSLVVKFDAQGVEQWAQRFGGANDDRANAVTIGEDGTVYVAGEARANFEGVTNQGSLDGYVRAIGADGQTLYTRAAEAGAGIERAQAVAMAADGGLITASEVDGRAVVTKYAAGDDGTGQPVWTEDLGDLNGGKIGGLAVDENGDIYLAGSAGAGFSPSAPVNGHAGGSDAFLVKLGDGAQASVDYTTFLGSENGDVATGVQVSDGKVYLSGSTSGSLNGEPMSGERNAFAAGFDAATGANEWSRQIAGRGGVSNGAGVAVDPQGDSFLDRIGLPSGKISYADTAVVTARSSVREGDHFYMSVDGGRPKKITIESGDTMRSLTFKINAKLLSDGNASVGRSQGGDVLRIEPREGVKIEFSSGDDGQDALEGLGLPEGLVTGKGRAGSRDETSDAPPVFELKIPSKLDLSNRDSAKAANESIQEAIETVMKAYRKLTEDPALKELTEGPANGKRGGEVPAYLKNQLSNYEAGLDRLMSGPQAGETLGFY